jgi:hypothetical protein
VGEKIMDAVLQKYADRIDRYGWAVVGVSGLPEEPWSTFAYSVGLTRIGAPELILFGLCPHTGARILNVLAGRVLSGEVLVDGDEVPPPSTIGPPIRLGAVPVDVVDDYLLIAHRFYPAEPFGVRALQVIWPDDEGRWPWEPTVDPEVAMMQPVWWSQ